MSNVKSMNSVMLVGRLGSEPQVKTYEFGAIASFSVATTKGYKDKNGQWQESTMWIPCSVMGAQAENVAKFLHKGDLVCVSGSISVRETTTESGKRQFVDVRVGEVQVLARSATAQPPKATPVDEVQEVYEKPTPKAYAKRQTAPSQMSGYRSSSLAATSGYPKRSESKYTNTPIPSEEIPDL